ncbi:MAG: PD-(D/E)XK nuclease domain-containing protein, partial [Selenomonadaceae bacterium]|nr:PD-(D/E)XK nuclease domain-containing protein [Selenomonadaceae bacterium]
AKEALRQIEEKAYLAELSRQGVKEVWKYGIAFCGKKVWMEQE